MGVYGSQVSVVMGFRSLHAGVQLLGWKEVHSTTKDDWKCFTAVLGEQSVMISSTTLMLVLSAIVLDSGWFCRNFFRLKVHRQWCITVNHVLGASIGLCPYNLLR